MSELFRTILSIFNVRPDQEGAGTIESIEEDPEPKSKKGQKL
jgi:hypothetical protein